MEPEVLVAIVTTGVVAGVVAGRLQRVAKRTRPDPDSAAPVVADSTMPLSTADQRFRLLSFQGGSIPADLGPVLEELRRNGIEVDEETLRQKLAENAAGGAQPDEGVENEPPDEGIADEQRDEGAVDEQPDGGPAIT